MNWFKKYWYYIFSFILGGIASFSDVIIILLVFGGFLFVLFIFVIILIYCIGPFIDYLFGKKSTYTPLAVQLTFCTLIFFIIAPITTGIMSNPILKTYGNHIIKKLENHKNINGSYPTHLEEVKTLPLIKYVYRYSINEESTFYLSYKSRALVRKYYDYKSKAWYEAPL